MNINSRIDWKAGMAISERTFIEMDENLARRQEVASRTVNGNQFGLIPFTEFNCQGGFVRNKLEIERLGPNCFRRESGPVRPPRIPVRNLSAE